MRKISWYLLIIIAVCAGIVGFWAYLRYFKTVPSRLLQFQVKRGDINEVVKVRGQVVAQTSFNMGFPYAGTVDEIYVKEGQNVKANDKLMKLDTIDDELGLRRLQAEQSQAQSNLRSAQAQLLQAQAQRDAQQARLAELKRGSRPEEINVQTSKVAAAQVSLADARQGLLDAIRDAYTKAEDAVRSKTDGMFSDPRGQQPQLNVLQADAGLKVEVEARRLSLEQTLKSWQVELTSLDTADPGQAKAQAAAHLADARDYLDKLAMVLGNALAGVNQSQATIDAWKTNLSAARTNVNLAISALTLAEEKWRAASSTLAIAQNELNLMKAGTAAEQIAYQAAVLKQADAGVAIQQAAVAGYASAASAARAQIDSLLEKIRKAVLLAPAAAKVTKINLEKQELYNVGTTAVALATTGFKIQADISELDIGKISEQKANPVSFSLDAYPGQKLTGKVMSVEPQEIDKEGDKYYRVNARIDDGQVELRSGMSADLVIHVQVKNNVLNIPELAVAKKADGSYVTLLANGVQQEVGVTTGLSDGENVEIVSGLTEGQTVVVTAE